MATNYLLPKTSNVTAMLGTLFGDGTLVKPGDPLGANGNNPVAIYAADDGTPVAAAVCDTAFAAYAGSALSLIPAGEAKKAASGTLSATMLSNLHEVMNICSRLLMDDNTPHLMLAALYQDPQKIPENAQMMLKGVITRTDIEVIVPHYGSGRLSLLIT